VWLTEFSPIADPGLVPVTVAAAVELDLGGGEVSAQRVSQGSPADGWCSCWTLAST